GEVPRGAGEPQRAVLLGADRAPAVVQHHGPARARRRPAQRQRAGAGVPPLPGTGLEHAPPRERAHVVVAALDLVVRVAAPAVVTAPHAVEDPAGLGVQALDLAVRGDLVLDAGPHLVAVARGDLRATAGGPGAHDQAALVAVGVGAVRVLEAVEVRAQVVLDHRPQRGPYVVARQQVPEVEQVRPPLPDQLVGQAALAPLERDRVAVLEDLPVVRTGEQRLVVPGAAGTEPLLPRLRPGVVPDGARELLGGPQRRQPVRA